MCVCVCRYNISTYENDIALIELELLPPYKDICVEQNSAISAVCVPWTTQLFSSPHTCSISGWGRTAGNTPTYTPFLPLPPTKTVASLSAPSAPSRPLSLLPLLLVSVSVLCCLF